MAHASQDFSFGITTPTANVLKSYEYNQFNYLKALVKQALQQWTSASPNIAINQTDAGTMTLLVSLTVYTEGNGVQSEFRVPDDEDDVREEDLPTVREANTSINSALFAASLYGNNTH